jgi:NAD(P)-dependent dehydrogenase (short-subunit alcohol dehydrogenase family)
MSPIKFPGAPDRDRGTAAEHISPGRFAGKVALVTGAGSGIGHATARRLAAEGATVACLDIAADAVGATVEQISAESAGGARAYSCDITDEASVADTVARANMDLGAVTVVCNVAGVGGFANTTEATLADWNRVIAVNLTGTFLVCRATLPSLLEHGGSITNVTSTAGVMGQPFSAAYCASKGGVSLLTKALAVEYVARGVRVNGVAPGGVDTPLLHDFGLPEGADGKAIERLMTPMGYCTPAEVAASIVFLASDEAGYISGSILSIDGALSA